MNISHFNGHFSLRYVKCQIWLIMKNDNLAISRNFENEAVFHREKNVSTSLANHCKVLQEGFELLAQYYG